MILHKIESFSFSCEEKTGEVFHRSSGEALQIGLEVNNPILLGEEVSEKFFAEVSKGYTRFRKGVGYKAEVHRIRYCGKGRHYFVNGKGRGLELSESSLRYVYPLVLGKDLKEEGVFWSGNYILFPYEYCSVKEVSQEVLKEKAPEIYAYFKEHEEVLKRRSKYNSRIQKSEEFYSLIRVGRYTYADWYVCTRDNTKLNACVVGKIRTHWGEEKMPIFDTHVNYLSFKDKEESLYAWKRLKSLEPLIQVLFDERSFSARIPFKL